MVLTSVACAHARAAPCDALRGVQLPNASIVAVTLVDSGTFVPLRQLRRPPAESFRVFRTLPAFCAAWAAFMPICQSAVCMKRIQGVCAVDWLTE